MSLSPLGMNNIKKNVAKQLMCQVSVFQGFVFRIAKQTAFFR